MKDRTISFGGRRVISVHYCERELFCYISTTRIVYFLFIAYRI